MNLDPLTIEFLRAYKKNKNVQPVIWRTGQTRRYKTTWSDGVQRIFTAGSTFEARITMLLATTIRGIPAYCEEITPMIPATTLRKQMDQYMNALGELLESPTPTPASPGAAGKRPCIISSFGTNHPVRKGSAHSYRTGVPRPETRQPRAAGTGNRKGG